MNDLPTLTSSEAIEQCSTTSFLSRGREKCAQTWEKRGQVNAALALAMRTSLRADAQKCALLRADDGVWNR
jgi:hypothetical protein